MIPLSSFYLSITFIHPECDVLPYFPPNLVFGIFLFFFCCLNVNLSKDNPPETITPPMRFFFPVSAQINN